MVKSGTVSIGTTPTLIHTAIGRTIIKIRNGNVAAVAIGDSSVVFPGGWMLSSTTPEAIVVELVLQDSESIYGRCNPAGTVINFIAMN